MTRPADQRSQALALLAEGEAVREAGRRLGVPATTISGWRRQLLSERRTEHTKREPAHNHPHDNETPVLVFDLHRTLTPATGFPLEPPYPGVKEFMDRMAARGSCIHIATAGLDHRDRNLVEIREATIWAWVRLHGLPVSWVGPKVNADVYFDDRMVPVPPEPADVDWRAIGLEAEGRMLLRFTLGDDGLYTRHDHTKVGTEITEWPELEDVPDDQPRGLSTPTVCIDIHRCLFEASGSTRDAGLMPGALEAVRRLYEQDYQILLSCAGWNPATHAEQDWKRRLAKLRQTVREFGVPYDRIVPVDHGDLRFDDKGIRMLDWDEDLPKIERRLRAPAPAPTWDPKEFAEDDERPPQTGVMVAFYLPDDVAEDLALDPEEEPTATPADELHLTLAYLGRLDGDHDAAFQPAEAGRLKRVVAGFAAIAPPVGAQVSGLGRFAVGERVVYASVDAPLLPAWRERLVQHLRTAGFEPSKQHGFTPHITLACPEGPTLLDVRPRAWEATTLTVKIGEERVDFPLEGTNVLAFADKPSDRNARREGDRPGGTSSPALNDRDIQQGQEEAQHAGVDKARDVAKRVAPGEPLPPRQPGTDRNEKGTVVSNVPEDVPRVIDHLQILAWKRYINLLANDVPHHRAIEAVKHIDPDFVATHYHMARILQALGRTREPVKFGEVVDAYDAAAAGVRAAVEQVQLLSPGFEAGQGDVARILEALVRRQGPVRFGWSAGTVEPPPHVKSVYDQFEYTQQEEDGIASYLLGLAKEAYLEAVNAQLVALGQPITEAITDEDVLAELERETRNIAHGIVETFNKDLAAEVYSNWIEQRSVLGRQSSRHHLAEAIERWAAARAVWKAEEIAVTETGRWYFRGVTDFLDFNPALDVVEVWVRPDECVCLNCQFLVNGNPYSLDEIPSLGLPLHPRCAHDVDVVYAGGAQPAALWRAAA